MFILNSRSIVSDHVSISSSDSAVFGTRRCRATYANRPSWTQHLVSSSNPFFTLWTLFATFPPYGRRRACVPLPKDLHSGGAPGKHRRLLEPSLPHFTPEVHPRATTVIQDTNAPITVLHSKTWHIPGLTEISSVLGRLQRSHCAKMWPQRPLNGD